MVQAQSSSAQALVKTVCTPQLPGSSVTRVLSFGEQSSSVHYYETLAESDSVLCCVSLWTGPVW